MDEVTRARRGCRRLRGLGRCYLLAQELARACGARRVRFLAVSQTETGLAHEGEGPDHVRPRGTSHTLGEAQGELSATALRPPRRTQRSAGTADSKRRAPLSAPRAIHPPNHSVAGLYRMGVHTPGPTLTSPLTHHATATTQPSHPENNVDLGNGVFNLYVSKYSSLGC